jgi:hypothetical protein
MKISHIIKTIERDGSKNQLFTLVKTQSTQNHKVEIAFIKSGPEVSSSFEELRVVINNLSFYRKNHEDFFQEKPNSISKILSKFVSVKLQAGIANLNAGQSF